MFVSGDNAICAAGNGADKERVIGRVLFNDRFSETAGRIHLGDFQKFVRDFLRRFADQREAACKFLILEDALKFVQYFPVGAESDALRLGKPKNFLCGFLPQESRDEYIRVQNNFHLFCVLRARVTAR